ncbi:MAG TPA: DUF58 domain-containing protein [Gammaproteobacteria bacterium]|nr:DUF58 domain-containing protein [Gammaproteobacteria bacterium]
MSLRSPFPDLGALARGWARRRQGPDGEAVELHRRRIYILPTALGLGYGMSLFGMLLAAMNYNNNMGFALTFLLAGLGLVTMHWAHQNLSGVIVRGIRLQPAFAGQPVRLDLSLQNTGRAPRHDLQAGCAAARSAFLDLAPGQAGELHLHLSAQHRGRLALDRIGVHTTFPFGLFRAWAWLHPECATVIYPAPAEHAPTPPAGGPEDPDGRWDEHRGEDDFAGLRDFRQGDSPRRIAWKAAARGDELPVKQFAGSARGSAWLDWDSLPRLPLEERLSVLCRWVLDAHAGGGAFGLRIPGTEIPPGMGPAHRHRCLAALALYQRDDESAHV